MGNVQMDVCGEIDQGAGGRQPQEHRNGGGKPFRRRGYDGVGITDVISAAGMTQDGSYLYFASKGSPAEEAWQQSFESALAIWR